MPKFEVYTPLGFSVRTTKDYWQRLLLKHPDIVDLEPQMIEALTQPDQIRRSSQDKNIYLFYRVLRANRWIVAVARCLNGSGFLITSYQTDAIKEGDQVWPR